MKIIDFHTHILPAIDDGSRSVEMSAEMLQSQQEQGVGVIVATPHFYAERVDIERFLRRRNRAWEKLREPLERTEIQLFRGAEVAYFPKISEAEGIDQLCIEGTNALLLELPFAQWDGQVYRDIERLLRNGRFQVILAHIERFPAFQRDKSVLEDVLDMPLLCQCNAGPLCEWTKRGKVLRFFKQGQAQLLGSDCHNLSSRKPNLAQGRKEIEKRLGVGALMKIDEAGNQLLFSGGSL